jgi:hypothetical protein
MNERKKEEFAGQKFHSLTAISFKEIRSQNHYWLFKCDCGKDVVKSKHHVKSGKGKSCGCHMKKVYEIRREEFVGTKFNMLTALSHIKDISWLFKCDCGSEKVASKHHVLNSFVKSCGCIKQGNDPHNSKNDPEYKIWIRVTATDNCDEMWHLSYDNFIKDVGKKPSKKHWFKRIDSKKPFSKDNCHWSSDRGSSYKGKLITIGNKTMNLTDWSRHQGMSYKTIWERINGLKWTLEEALELKPRQ